jgi:hypothetical protein
MYEKTILCLHSRHEVQLRISTHALGLWEGVQAGQLGVRPWQGLQLTSINVVPEDDGEGEVEGGSCNSAYIGGRS